MAGIAAAHLGGTAEVVAGDGRAGWAAGAPYDAIVVTAGADTLAPAWFEQVRAGGRLVVPLRFEPGLPSAQAVVAFTRDFTGFTSYAATPAYFLPLRAAEGDDAVAAARDSRVAALVAHDELGGGELVRITGPALAVSAPTVRAAVLATALTVASSRRLPTARPFDLLTHLALALPAERVVAVTRPGRVIGIGAIGRDGDSLALVVPGPGTGNARLERYGSADAEARLVQAEVDRFARSAGTHDLAVVFGAHLAGAPDHHRRQYERDGVVLTVDPAR